MAPVGIPGAVAEADELGRVLLHQVTGAEVGVTFGEDPPQQLLLRQLPAAGVAQEGGPGGHRGDQQPRLACGDGIHMMEGTHGDPQAHPHPRSSPVPTRMQRPAASRTGAPSVTS